MARDFVARAEAAKAKAEKKPAPDFISRIPEHLRIPTEEKEEPKKQSFTERFGQALSMQMKSGGPAGAPALQPKEAKKVAVEFATMAAVEAAFAPILGLAAASKVAPRVLTAITRLTQAGATGTAVATTEKLVEEGELPGKEELLKNGLEWVAIDAIMQGLHFGAAGGKFAFDFGKAVSNAANRYNLPKTKILSKLWDEAKRVISGKFGRKIETPQDIRPEDVKVLEDVAKRVEKEPEIIVPKEAEPVVEKPKEIKPEEVKPPVKEAEQKPSIAQEVKETKPAEPRVEEKAVEKPKETAKEPEKPENFAVWEDYFKKATKNPPKTTKEKIRKVNAEIEKLSNQYETARPENKKEILETYNDISKYKDYLQELDAYETSIKPKAKPKAKALKPLPAKQPKGKRPASLAYRRPIIGKVQAQKRSEILTILRKAFRDPIRLGKISQRKAVGIHKGWARVSRLLKDNDIETAAHEIGHNLHYLLYEGQPFTPQQQQQNVDAALRPYLNELKPLALYAPYGKEGFAEFVRLYVTNPSVAQQMAPNFYAKFEADLQAQQPEIKNALLKARDYYDQYLQGTPESRIRAQTSYGTDATFLENIKQWLERHGNLDDLKTQFLDDVFPAKRLVAEAFGIPVAEVENLKDERNLYRALRVLKGAIGKADVFLLHETFDPITLKRKGRGLRQILRKLKTEEEYKEFNDYLIARRVTEKALQNIETGISYGDAIITERKLAPKYKRLAILLDHYSDSLLSYARDAGLISSDEYKMIKKNNLMYAPFQRVMEKEKGGVAGTSGKIQAGKPIKQMKGSTRDIIAPVESFIKNTYDIIINAEKNLSGQVLAKLAEMKGVGGFVERVPTPMALKGKILGSEVEEKIANNLFKQGLTSLVVPKVVNGRATFGLRQDVANAIPQIFLRFGPTNYPAGENIVTVFHDGKPTYYEVSPEIYEMWTRGLAPYTANLLTKILRIPARTLRAGAILNPVFLQKNFVRDTWGGYLFTRYGKDVKNPVNFAIDTFLSPLAMVMTAAKKGKLYVEFLKAGAGMSTMQSLDRDTVVKKLQEVRDGYKPYQIISWLRQAGSVLEESNRMAEFGRALEVEGKTRLGMEIAAFAARDLSIDFAKMGLQMKAINQIITFFNATIQGTDKAIRQAINPETRAEYLTRAIAFVVVPSLIFSWLNKDDDRINEFYEEEKDFNFITFIGDRALKIPVPFETGVIFHGFTRRLYDYVVKKDPKAFEEFMGSIISACIPNVIPTFANPFVETYANRNFFTNAPIIPRDKEALISKYQYKRGTSPTARFIGRAMTYMPFMGEDTRSKAASPAIIDHFINSWTAGLGKLIRNFSDAALVSMGLEEKVPGPEETVLEQLGLDAFTKRYPRASSRSIERFYDNYADATARQKSIKLAKKEDLEEPEELEKTEARFDALYDYAVLQRAYTAMQNNRRSINNIWNDPTIKQELKQKMVDDLYLEQIAFAKEANESMELHRLVHKKPKQ